MRHTRTLFFITLVSICLSANMFAQETTAEVTIRVTAANGEPIAGALVGITSTDPDSPREYEATANNNGFVVIALVPAGRYEAKANAGGFREFAKKFELIPAQKLSLQLVLNLSVGLPAVVDNPTSRTILRTGPVTTTYQIERTLPSGPTFTSLTDVSPFVRLETLAGGIAVDGATAPDNIYYFDSQQVTNPVDGTLPVNYDIPVMLYSQVRVVSGVEEANSPGSIGGGVSIETSSATEDWHGDFGISFKPGGLNGGSRPLINRYGTGNGQFEFFQPNSDDSNSFFPHGTLGGKVIEDKLFFFAAYTPLIYRNRRTIDYYSSPAPGRSVVQSIDYEENIRQDFAFLRLDSPFHDNFRANASFLWNPTIQDGALPSTSEGLFGVPQAGSDLTGADYLATRGGRNNSNLFNANIQWRVPNWNYIFTGHFGRNFLNEKLGTYGSRDETRYLCSTSGSPQSVPGSNCAPGFNTGSNFATRLNAHTRTSTDLEGVFRFDWSNLSQQVRGGYQYDQVDRNVNQGYVETGFVVLYYGVPLSQLGIPVPPNPDAVGSGLFQRFGTIADTKSRNQAIYALDEFRFSGKLTLNIGVRFEKENVAQYGGNDEVRFGWADKISPRLSGSYNIFNNGKSTISASYFWNYDRLKNSFFEDFGGSIFARDYFEILPSRGVAFDDYTYANILGGDTNINDEQCPIINGPGYSVCRFQFRSATGPFGPQFPFIDPNLKPTKQETFTVSVNQIVPGDLQFQARYIRNDLNNAVEDIGVFNDQGSEFYLLGNPGEGLACEIGASSLLPCPKAERRYDAFEVSIDKRSRDYFFNASYNFSRLKGNYSGLRFTDSEDLGGPNSTPSFDLPPGGFTANGVPDNGRLPIDRPHAFKAYGGYTYRWTVNSWTNVSAFTTVQSGTPLTTYYNLYNQRRSILFGRGDLGRTEKFSETDLRVGHKFNVGSGEEYTFEIFADILNLFDEKNELSRQTLISSTNFTASTLTAAGCTTCQNEAIVFDTIFNQGGIEQFVINHLNTKGVSSGGTRNDYNQPNLFQQARSVRFGVRMYF